MFAVIKTGGKQYKVAAEDVITIERLPGEAGETIIFNDVLLVQDGAGVQVGAPMVSGASVAGMLVEQARDRRSSPSRSGAGRIRGASAAIARICRSSRSPISCWAAPSRRSKPRQPRRKPRLYLPLRQARQVQPAIICR